MTTVFIVGMPRSGTKLLRDLMNSNPDVAIFPHESHMFPMFHRRWSHYGDARAAENFAKFHADFSATVFSRRMAARGLVFDREAWHGHLDGGDFGDVLRALFRLYSTMTGCRVVGDKTPSYLVQTPLLAQLLPGSRFIHIVRDPRDYAVSVTRAWGKNPVRAAQRWKTQIRRWQADTASRPDEHFIVRYEQLLSHTATVMQEVCGFVGIAFDERMMRPAESSERRGLASGANAVVQNNHGQWQKHLDAEAVRRIESVCGLLMRELGYSPSGGEGGDADLPSWQMELLRMRDGINLLGHHRRECGGWLPAVRHMRQVTAENALDE